MGTAKAALALCLLMVTVTASTAGADACVATTSTGSPFATCFDVGNRLFLEGGSDGVGFGIRLRQTISFEEEPDLNWKLSHRLLDLSLGGLHQRYKGVLYSGRYLRHSRDGHIVLPWGTPRKIFLPFDIGGETEVGRVMQQEPGANLRIGVVRVAGLIDVSRTASFRRRLAFGVLATWDVDLDAKETRVAENRVAPLSMLTGSGYLESRDGLSSLDLDVDGGRVWSSESGWGWQGQAHIALERIVLAFNDRPLSLVAAAEAHSMDSELKATLGLRFGVLSAPRIH